MSLSDYIKQRGKDGAVGALVGLDRSTVSRIRRGVIDPPYSTVAKIVSATGGKLILEPPGSPEASPQPAPQPEAASA